MDGKKRKSENRDSREQQQAVASQKSCFLIATPQMNIQISPLINKFERA
jgi:hypothetical protein